MTSITPFLWFDNNLPEAVAFYKSVFPNAKVETVNGFMATFELEGQKFNALNGGPKYKFNEAISFFISVESQEEVDYFWNRLIADGCEESKCAWLKGQIRPVLAGCAHGPRPLPERSRSQKGRSRHAGHDEDAKDRHRRPRQGICRLIASPIVSPTQRRSSPTSRHRTQATNRSCRKRSTFSRLQRFFPTNRRTATDEFAPPSPAMQSKRRIRQPRRCRGGSVWCSSTPFC